MGHARPRPSEGGPAPAALVAKAVRPVGSCGEQPGVYPGGGRWQGGIWGASLSLAQEMGPERCADPAPGRTLANWPSLRPLPRNSWVMTGPPCPCAQSALPVRARQGGLSSSADGKAATQRGEGTAPRPHSHAGGLRLHVQPPDADMASPSEPGVPRLHLEGFLGVTDSEQGQQQSPGPVACK